MQADGWIAEEPEVHLLPGLRGGVEASGSRWASLRTADDDGVFVVGLEWLGRA